jgi:hypothetical protein
MPTTAVRTQTAIVEKAPISAPISINTHISIRGRAMKAARRMIPILVLCSRVAYLPWRMSVIFLTMSVRTGSITI